MKTPSKQLFIKLSLGACVAFFLVLAWASKSDPEKDQQVKKEASDFYALMGKIYNDVNSRITAGPQPMELSAESEKLLATTDGSEPQAEIQAVYLPVMKRFTVQDTTEWSNNYSPWEWITGPIVEGIGNVNDPKFYYYSDVTYRIGEIKKGKLLAVIAPASGTVSMPTLSEDKTNFTPGNFSGWLFLANTTDGTIVAAYPLQVQSSDIVEFRSGGMGIAKLFDSNPEEAIKVDFQDKFEEAVNTPLMGKGHITLEGGSLL